MPSYTKKIQIPGKSSDELYSKVSETVDRFLEKSNLGGTEVKRDAGSKQLHLKHSMVSATISCLEGSIDVDAKLSFLAAPFKGKIDEGIQKWLSKTFDIS